MQDNVAGALCFVTGIIFLVLAPMRRRPFVRIHAFQPILFNIAWLALWIALGTVTSMMPAFTLVLVPIALLTGLGGLCLWLFLMWKVHGNAMFKLPVIGNIAEEQARKH
jgi:uncharacterized membrane protein